MTLQLKLFDDLEGRELLEFRIQKMEDRIEKARRGLFLRYGELEGMLKELKSQVESNKAV